MAKRRRKNSVHRVARRRVIRRRRANPAMGVTKRRRRSYRHRAAIGSRRRRNPVYRVKRVGRRRSNPGIGGLTSGIMGKAIGFISGMIGARYLTQAVLQGNNTGYVGYAGNVAASVLLGMLASKATKSKDFGSTVMIGGIASTIMRVVSEKTSYGSYIQTALSGSGKGGDVGIGIITDTSFYSPQTFAPGSMTNAVVPRAVTGYVGAQLAQQAAMRAAGSPGKGMGSMVGRRNRGAVV